MATGKEVKKVGVSTPTQDVIQFDEDGARLDFDLKEFPYLPSDVIKKLSKANRLAYGGARVEYELDHDPENGDVLDDLVINPEDMRLGAVKILNADLKKGLEGHHTRPDKLDSYKQRGWKVASKSDFKDPEIGEHSMRVRRGGYDELILMSRPKEVGSKFKKQHKKYNDDLVSGKSLEEGMAEIKQEGLEVTTSEYSRK